MYTRIRELRQEHGIGQKVLSIELGVSQPTICDWENEKKIPSVENFSKLAKYFNVSMEYLLGLDEDESSLGKIKQRLAIKFKERFTNLLTTKGVTAAKLAKDTGLSDAVISQWKNGKQVPSADKLIVLADYFDVSIDYLVGRVDDPALQIQMVDTDKGSAELHVSEPLTDDEIVKFREILKKLENGEIQGEIK